LKVVILVATRLMGIEPIRLKYLNYFIRSGHISMEDISVSYNSQEGEFFNSYSMYLDFCVPESWKDIKASF
jgi:hypothetical protein